MRKGYDDTVFGWKKSLSQNQQAKKKLSGEQKITEN